MPERKIRRIDKKKITERLYDKCNRRGCKRNPEYLVIILCIDGRINRKAYCPEHAREFSRQYNVKFPEDDDESR